MPYILPDWVPVAVAAAVCLLTWLRGDGETRFASTYTVVTLAICVAAPPAIRSNGYAQTAWQLLDVVVFCALAWRSSRWWTVVLASVALVDLVTATAMIWSSFSHWAIGTAELVWLGGYDVTLIVAACTTRRAARGDGRADRQAEARAKGRASRVRRCHMLPAVAIRRLSRPAANRTFES